MPTQAQISNRILRGQLLQLSLASSFAQQESWGNYNNFWDECVFVSNLVQALQFQQVIQAYDTQQTLVIYNKLGGILGARFINGASLDPNAQLPHTVVVITGGGALAPITFTITAHVTPTPLTITYDASVYTSVQYTLVRVSNNSFDWNTNVEWTPGVYTLFGDDFGDGTWDDSYVFTIYGQTTGTSSGGGSGGGAFVLTFTEASLLQDGSGNWFLPLSLPTGLIPIAVTSNGETVTIDWNVNFSPNRLYGFSNNDAQSIVVKSI